MSACELPALFHLRTDSGQESLNDAADLTLPQHPGFTLVSLVTPFEASHRDQAVLAMPFGFAISGKTTVQN